MATNNTINTKILLRSDTAARWADVNPKLGKGEVGIELDTNKIKIGDNTKTWNELPYFGGKENTYQDNIDTNGEAVGDIAVVKTLIEGDKYSYTSYVWNGTAWAAMDGNYNASNVYFDKDIQVTRSVGNVTTSNNAPVDLKFKGKNMEEIWQYLYATEDTYIEITGASASIALSKTSDTLEVGESYTLPTASVSTSSGKYHEYGGKKSDGTKISKDTNINDITFDLTLSYLAPGETTAVELDSKTGVTSIGSTSIPEDDQPSVLVVTDSNITHTFKGTYKHTGSAYKPVTNLGNYVTAIKSNSATSTSDYDDGAAGIAARTTAANMGNKTYIVYGYRWMYAGGTTSALSSSVIRRLSASRKHSDVPSGSDLAEGSPTWFEFTAEKGTTEVVFAYPEGVSTKTPTFQMFGLAWADNSNFEARTDVKVADKREQYDEAQGKYLGEKTYKIYSWKLDTPLEADLTKFRVAFK